VPHHRPVETVLRHFGAVAPALFGFAPLGPAVLVPDLQKSKEPKLVICVWGIGGYSGVLSLLSLFLALQRNTQLKSKTGSEGAGFGTRGGTLFNTKIAEIFKGYCI